MMKEYRVAPACPHPKGLRGLVSRSVEDGARLSRVLTCTLSAAGIAGVDTGPARKVSLTMSVELLGLP